MSTIERLFNQTATVYKKQVSTSFDANVSSYDAGTEIVCRAQSASDTLTTNDYREHKIDIEMWTRDDTDVAEQDRIEYEGNNYSVDEIDVKRNRNGTKHHKKLLLIREKTNG